MRDEALLDAPHAHNLDSFAPLTAVRPLAGNWLTPTQCCRLTNPLRGLRCDAEVFVLMEDRVLRIFVIVLVLEEALSR